MQLCSGAVNVHCREDVVDDGEAVQCVAVNASGTILAVLTQLHIHFWAAGPKTVYLTSLSIPDTTLEDNPAMFVLWRQRQGNHLAVITSRQVVFFEADINLKHAEFLQTVERKRYSIYMRHVDSASRVCYSCQLPIETGLVTCAATAGPYAFLVTTTAGVVYVIGWHQQDILHQWTTVGLQGGGHTITTAAEEEEALSGAMGLSSASMVSSSAAAAAAPAGSGAGPTSQSRSSHGLTPTSTSLRSDPLQRRYQQGGVRAQPSQQGPAQSTGAPFQPTSPLGFVPGEQIRPPGTAVRSVEDGSASGTSATSPTFGPPTAAREGGEQQLGEGEEEEGDSESEDTASTAAAAQVAAAPMTAHRPSRSQSSLTFGACGADGASSLRRNNSNSGSGADRLSGTILHASFTSRGKLLSFVFSSGNVLLCRASCGTNFTHTKVQLQGCVTPIVSACMVAMNMRHLLLAVCTQAGAISCRRFDSTSLAISSAPLWKGLRGVQDGFTQYGPTSSAPQSLGLIAAMEWSPSEELLCVAFYKHGMVLVHYSGAVVTHHLSGPTSATLLRSPSPLPSTAAFDDRTLGCSSVTWKPDGTRLWMTAPGQPCFFSTQLSRVLAADTVGPTTGNHTPLALLADDGLYLVSVSKAAGRQGVRELVLLPDEYLRDQFPLLYGAVSFDGNWVACAGRRGLVIFSRDRYSWKLASKKQEEAAFSCVADPVWLRNVAVAVPALRTDSKTYELIVLSTSSVSPSHALARVALDGRPSQLSCVHQDHRGEGYLVVVDCNQIVRVLRYDVFVDATTSANGSSAASKPYVALTPVQQLVLTADLANPLQVLPVCLRSAEDDHDNPQRTHDQVELRLLLHRRTDHALVWVRGEKPAAAATASGAAGMSAAASSNGSLVHVNAISEPFDKSTPPAFVHHCWVDRTPPVRGAVLLTHEEGQGLMLYQLQQPERSSGSSGSVAPTVLRMDVMPTRDSELLPLCVSPFDGYVLCIGTDTSVPRLRHRSSNNNNGYGDASGMIDLTRACPHPQLLLRPVLYAHRLLSLLLLAAMPAGASAQAPHTSSNAVKTALTGALVSRASSSTTFAAPVAGNAVTPAAAASTTTTAAEVDGRVASFLWDRNLFYWLERMRLNDTFVAVMDYFLHTALNESPPAAVPGLSRRSAVRAVINLLRNYPEFYAIVVGCVRKIDFTRWHLVLDFLGTPTDLFHECVAHHCYAEAVHLVRVIMMGSYRPSATLSVERVAELRQISASGSDAAGSTTRGRNSGSDVGSLEQASQCAIELFGLSIENGDYTAAYDLLRFMALLEEEIGMPAAGGFDMHGSISGGGEAEGGGGSEGFLTRWLRQLTFSGAAYDDPEAAVEEPAENAAGAAATANTAVAAALGKTGKAAGKASKTQIDDYPTLVLDAARCEEGRGGRSAEEAAEEVQRQSAVRHMFRRHKALPAVVHQEALRLLRTGFVTQLAKLMETFSLSVAHFLDAAGKLLDLRAAEDDSASSAGDESGECVPVRLHDVFDGLHKELGLPRSFHVPSAATAGTAWNTWLVEQQTAQAARLPGVLSATNPRVWTVAQSALYATPNMLHSVETLHQLFRDVFVYDMAFCLLRMRKSDLISLLLSGTAQASPQQTEASKAAEPNARAAAVSAEDLIAMLDQLEALLSVAENAAYKPFLQDVFQSLPPSALRACKPRSATDREGGAAVLPAPTEEQKQAAEQ